MSWELQVSPNHFGGFSKLCEFDCAVSKLEAVDGRLLATLVDGSTWMVTDAGEKTLVASHGGDQ